MSDILSFLLKRIIVLYVVLIIVCFLINYQRIPMIIALTFSIFFSLLRFAVAERILKAFSNSGNKNKVILANVLLYLLYFVILCVIIVLSIKIGVYTFFAALVGTLMVVFIITVNAITEALGITRNQFGQKVK